MSFPRTWKEEEDARKNEILELFWEHRVLHPSSKEQKDFSLTAIKDRFLLALPPPEIKQEEWIKKINKAWEDKSVFNNKETFFKLFEHVASVQAVAEAEGFSRPLKIKKEAVTITEKDCKTFYQYIKDRNLTVSAAFGSVKTKVFSGCAEGYTTSDIFTTHSLTKIFTGVLALRLTQEGILTDEDLTSKPIKLKKSTMDLLSKHSKILKRLEEVSLHQALTHHAGLGVGKEVEMGDYYGRYIAAIDKARKASASSIPEIKSVEDFLQFVPDQVDSFGEKNWHYSNSGIVLAALSLEHLYNEYRLTHPEKKLEELNFDGLLTKYISGPKAAGMKCFVASAKGLEIKCHPKDLNAKHMVGSPGGGYFSTIDDLVKFASWMHKQCQDPVFIELITKYGQEFCPFPQSKIIEHTGDGPLSSGFFSFNWETGNLVIVLNDQRSVAASEVGREVRDHFLMDMPVVEEKGKKLMSSASIAKSGGFSPAILDSESSMSVAVDSNEKKPALPTLEDDEQSLRNLKDSAFGRGSNTAKKYNKP